MYVVEVPTYEGTKYLKCHYPANGMLVDYPGASLYPSEYDARRIAREILSRPNLKYTAAGFKIKKVP